MTKLIKNSFLIGMATFIILGLEYFFQSFLAHKFTMAEFGLFAAAYSLLFILSTVTTSGLALQVTKHVIKKDKIKEVFSNSVFISLSINTGLGLFLIGASYFLVDLRHFLLILAILLILYPLLQLFKAILYGQEDYPRYSAITVMEVLAKLAFSIILIFYFNSIIFAFVGFVLADALMIVLNYNWVRKAISLPQRLKMDLIKKLIGHAAPITLVVSFSTSFLRMDTVLIKFLNSNIEAAYYNVAAVFGRTIFYLLSAIPFVIFPGMVNLNKIETKIKFKKIVPFFVLIIILINALTYFFVDIPLRLFFPKYLLVAPLIKILIFSMSLFSMANLFMVILIAQEEYKTSIFHVLIANILLLSLILLLKKYSTYGYAFASLISSSILLFFLSLKMLKLFRGKTKWMTSY